MPAARTADARAAAVLAEMAAVRGRIEADAARVADAAGRATDWTVYVKAAPLACAAGAAVAGYLIVPARRRKKKVVVTDRGKSGDLAPAARGPLPGVLTVLGNVALRAGTAYVSQQAGKAFGTAAATSGPAAEPRQPAEPPR